MRIIGVDPGLASCGVGVIDKLPGVVHPEDGLSFIHTEALRPPRGDLSQRLLYLHQHLVAIIRETQVEVMAVEDQFSGKNIQTAFKTGQAKGAALLAAAHCGIPVSLYSPARVKLAVVGNGRASKEQVRYLVGQILSLKSLPDSMDCSDALAVALCHALSFAKPTLAFKGISA